jgi:hypothetical protein
LITAAWSQEKSHLRSAVIGCVIVALAGAARAEILHRPEPALQVLNLRAEIDESLFERRYRLLSARFIG